MAKKRRTKAQKQRAATHRVEQLKSVLATAAEAPKRVTSAQAKPYNDVEARPAPADFRRRDLKRSLVVLIGLVLLMVIFWLVFTLTNLDTALYNWIKI